MANKKTCGIYKITNLINNKTYIGQSVEIEKRWKRHKNELNKGVHKNEHIQRSWNKYKSKNFKFEVIEKCSKNELNEREIYWIAYYNSNDYDKGYNLDSGGTEGKKLNESVKDKIGKRKYPNGEECTNSKLTNSQVIEIRKLLSEDKLTYGEIGRLFNVKSYIIYNIKKFNTYTYIKTEYDNIIKKLSYKNKRGNRNQKLNKAKVLKIKKLLVENKITRIEIAKLFGVKRDTINAIKNLETWSDVGEEYNEIIKNQNNREKLTKEDVVEIQKLINDGLTNTQIARQYNVDPSSISNIKTGKIWKNVKLSEEESNSKKN